MDQIANIFENFKPQYLDKGEMQKTSKYNILRSV